MTKAADKTKGESEVAHGKAITIELSINAIEILKHLQRTGLYGLTIEEVVTRLIDERLRGFVKVER